MTVRYFLQLPGIQGGSTVTGRQGWFDVLTYDLGRSQPRKIPSGTSGGFSGDRGPPKELHVVTSNSKEVHRIHLAITTGRRIKTATLEGISYSVRPNGTLFLRTIMTDVTVNSSSPYEKRKEGKYLVAFGYVKIRWAYFGSGARVAETRAKNPLRIEIGQNSVLK